MSRADYSAATRALLDRFEAPSLSDGFADRVMAATTAAAPALPPHAANRRDRRDRRGLWRRARQVTLVTAALGMTSAAAVASGLLGAAGIRVPVLTEMLAPAPVVVAKAPAPKPKPKALAVAKPVAPPPAVAPPVIETLPDPIEAQRIERRAAMIARVEARRAERRAFLARYPGLREAIIAGPEARRAYLRDNPAALAEVQARAAEHRAKMIERRRAGGDTAAVTPLAQLTPEERAARIEDWRVRRAAMRELRRARLAARPDGGATDAAIEPGTKLSEGNLSEPR